jgi:hypothetical protein
MKISRRGERRNSRAAGGYRLIRYPAQDYQLTPVRRRGYCRAMKNRTLRGWRRVRLWAGLLAVVALVSGEIWLVCSFSRDCAQTVAQADQIVGFVVSENFFLPR